MTKKGDNPFFEELGEEEVTVNEKKAEMFSQKESVTPKVEAKSDRIIAYLEPSLKKRLVDCAAENDVKYAVIVRAAIAEYLEKRGM